jgi:hypothetical protein
VLEVVAECFNQGHQIAQILQNDTFTEKKKAIIARTKLDYLESYKGYCSGEETQR